MPFTAEDLARRITAAIPAARATVSDTTGGGDHFQARVIAPGFTGLSLVKRHQMVYAVFKDELATGELHALALETWTPDEEEQKR